jgi:hypothetical protein
MKLSKESMALLQLRNQLGQTLPPNCDTLDFQLRPQLHSQLWDRIWMQLRGQLDTELCSKISS